MLRTQVKFLSSFSVSLQRATDTLDELFFHIGNLEKSFQVGPVQRIGQTRNPGAGAVDVKGTKAYETVMENAAPHILSYFPEELWSHAILYTSFEHVWINTAEEFYISVTLKAVCIMMFSYVGNMSKNAFDTPIGRSLSKYRHALLGKVLSLARATLHSSIRKDLDISL